MFWRCNDLFTPVGETTLNTQSPLPQQQATVKRPSLVGGTAIIAGTVIGAGMFSLPVVSAGMGFTWSLLCLLLTWFCMLHSGLLVLETNLNFAPGTSFDTFIGQVLGPRWNLLNNLTLVFVLYILSYAFISGGGSIMSQTLFSATGLELPPRVSGFLFALLIALIVWLGTAMVSRITSLLVAGMVISFAWSILHLVKGVQPALLLDIKPEYMVYSLAALPVYLTSFGFHTNVPSLVKYYGKDPKRVWLCLVYGTLIALATYVTWQVVTLGQIPRDEFRPIVAQGGNIGTMVAAISSHQKDALVLVVLNTFANLAVVSSFLGGALGLFDYIADKFKFDDGYAGRLKSTAVTFLPPTLASLVFPNGFIFAIGFAGLAATVFAIIIPARAAQVSRRSLGTPLFRVWGGNVLLNFLLLYGAGIAVVQLLATIGILPVFGR
ncbi:MAG: aromatic amino acid transporter [Xanthomonadales bacterium]|nr:aromatic amino acid transporter [Xanthomonadales bacterium]